jgi:hypothetical protein
MNGKGVNVSDRAKRLQCPVPYAPPDGWETRKRWHSTIVMLVITEMRDPETGEWIEYHDFTAVTYEPSGDECDGVPVWQDVTQPPIYPSGKLPLVAAWA